MKCDIVIPDITSSMPVKQQIGLQNARKFKAHIEEGLTSGTLPLHGGYLNRKQIAKDCKFGRSAFAQNEHIKSIADWADKILNGKSSRSKGSSYRTEQERDLASENQRIKDRNVALKVELEEAQKKLQRLDYVEKSIECGEVRLPW